MFLTFENKLSYKLRRGRFSQVPDQFSNPICCQYQLFALIQKGGCINGEARESADKSVDLEETRLTSYP